MPLLTFTLMLAASFMGPWRVIPSTARDDTGRWYEARLATNLPPDARLVLRSYVSELQLFVDDRQVYDFRDDAAACRMRVHVIELPRGTRLRARIPQNAREPYLAGSRVVARADLPLALLAVSAGPLTETIDDLFVGMLIASFGLIAMLLGVVRRRGDPRALLYFGAFAFLYGARLVVQSGLFSITGLSLYALQQVEWVITYVIPIPGWALADRLIGEGWKKSLRWQVWAFALFAPIAIASDLIRRDPGSLEPVNNLLVILGGINILLNLIVTRHRRETRPVLIGSIVFMLFALANNLTSLDLLPFDDIDETPGFVIFLGTLGYAAARQFAKAEQEQIALQSELTAAREIQRSILPAAMPRVAGLSVSAQYIPASTVAGDLYDFLEVDERRCGVLVADVSGHGIPAALVASMVKVAVTSQARLANDPAAMMRELNAILARDVRRGFVTATYLFFDGMSVHVANAGHPAPLLLRNNEVRELGAVNPLLGRFKTASYSAEMTELQPGDRIVAYTDGITEARNARGEVFGEERLHALLREGGDLVAAVQAWRGGGSDVDDLTLVVIDVRSPSGTR